MRAQYSKFGNLGEARFGTPLGPLVVQNTTSVRCLTGFNNKSTTCRPRARALMNTWRSLRCKPGPVHISLRRASVWQELQRI